MNVRVVEDYFGPVHVNQACVYCNPAARANPDPWEWYARGTYHLDCARYTWAGVVRDAVLRHAILSHPVTPEGSFYCGGPTDLAATSERVALPLCYEEALRHVQYEEHALDKLFRALSDAGVRAAAGTAWRLGGRFALRDFLRGAGAL